MTRRCGLRYKNQNQKEGFRRYPRRPGASGSLGRDLMAQHEPEEETKKAGGMGKMNHQAAVRPERGRAGRGQRRRKRRKTRSRFGPSDGPARRAVQVERGHRVRQHRGAARRYGGFAVDLGHWRRRPVARCPNRPRATTQHRDAEENAQNESGKGRHGAKIASPDWQSRRSRTKSGENPRTERVFSPLSGVPPSTDLWVVITHRFR